ncbi:larval/pupal cuticle protein H1C-like [Diaphorina citri]|uniref:Larval/pupal cuticle protein H1C-like n=1 Tax=Diaphorina citri TaxID=121845 RepID=A0A1S3D7L1_DIACI|nr:larval/pupal cuticle protein H1C-like [Diaphorina citri]XP_026687672.1 larval/pupal cuticle protein H1C-like [Diaphorina citri]
MFCKLALLTCLLVAVQAGDYPSVAYVTPSYAHSAVGSQSQSVVRSLDGNSVHSVYSKAVDTPFSSVRKYDSRVSNDAIAYAHAPVYHAPVYSAPVVKSVAPVTYAAAPVLKYAAPYPYHAPVVKSIAHPVAYSPVAYHAPVSAGVAPYAVKAPYSPAAVVSHVDFDGYGVHYAF